MSPCAVPAACVTQLDMSTDDSKGLVEPQRLPVVGAVHVEV